MAYQTNNFFMTRQSYWWQFEKIVRTSYPLNICLYTVLGIWISNAHEMAKKWSPICLNTTVTNFIEDVITKNRLFTYS